MRTYKSIFYFAVPALSVAATLLVSELVLRVFSTETYFVRTPNSQMLFKPVPGIMPGVSGVARVTFNALGMRGDPWPNDDTYKILAIGGSTTENLYLDQTETWPQLLQDKLNARGKTPVWVGNVGASGNNTRHHLLQAEKLLEQYPEVSLIVLLVGINDLSLRLMKDENYRLATEEGSEYQQRLLNQAFAVHPVTDEYSPVYQRTELWKQWQITKSRVVSTFTETQIQDQAGRMVEKWREYRKSAANIRRTLPNLSSAVLEYAQNIHAIIDLAQDNGTRVVLFTQPTMWRQDLPEPLADLLWFGGIGSFLSAPGKDYYSVSGTRGSHGNLQQDIAWGLCNQGCAMSGPRAVDPKRHDCIL